MAELEKALRPGPADRVRQSVAGLLMAYPAAGVTSDVATARIAAFSMALEDMPAWTVEKAVLAWLRGEGGTGGENYAFAPSPAQLYRLAAAARAETKYRHWVTERLLVAEVQAPEEKVYVDPARIKEILEKAVATSEAPKAPAAPPQKPNLNRVLDECEARRTRREAGTTPTAEAAE